MEIEEVTTKFWAGNTLRTTFKFMTHDLWFGSNTYVGYQVVVAGRQTNFHGDGDGWKLPAFVMWKSG